MRATRSGRQTCGWVVTALVMALALGCAPVLKSSRRAAPSLNDWTAVMELRPSQPVRASLEGGRIVEGRLAATAVDSITIAVAGDEETIARADVLLVVLPKTPASVKASRGALVGGALGAATGMTTGNGLWVLMLGSGWSALGALIGAIDGASERDVLIYAR